MSGPQVTLPSRRTPFVTLSPSATTTGAAGTKLEVTSKIMRSRIGLLYSINGTGPQPITHMFGATGNSRKEARSWSV